MLEKLIVDIICYCSVAKSCPTLCDLRLPCPSH